MERDLKLGILAVIVFTVAVVAPAFAKAAHGRHAHHASSKGAVSGQGVPAARKSPAADNAGDKIDVDVPEMSLPSRNAGRVVMPKLEIAKPDNSPGRRIGVSGPYRPGVRNALGQPIAPAINPRSGEMNLQAKKQPQAANPGQIQGGAGIGTLNSGMPNVRPSESISPSNRGKIDGAGLIRPSLASSLGGPAKSVTGINGTLVHPKHK